METTDTVSNFSIPRWIIILAAALLLVAFGYRFLASSPPSAFPAYAATGGAADSSPTTAAEQRVLAGVEAERRAIARSKLLSLSQTADQIRAAIAQLETEIAAWKNEIEPLLGNDSGKLLAANVTYVKAFQQIYRGQQRPGPETPERIRALLASSIEPVQKALKDAGTAYSPSQDLEAQLLQIKTSANDAIAAYQDPRRQIYSMLASAGRDLNVKPSAQTLTQVMDAMLEQQALQEARAIADALETEQKRNQERLAQFEVEKTNRDAERELTRKRQEEEIRQHEAERELARKRDEEQRKADQARIDELKTRAADPAVQAKYKPFLTKGRYRFHRFQVNPDKPTHYDYAQIPSLQRLRECAILDNAAVFWKTGTALSAEPYDRHGYTGQGYGNDRPAWSGYPQSEEEWKNVKKLYQDFLDLAPYWVETGVLRP